MKYGYTIIFVEDINTTVAFYEKAFGLERQVVAPNFAQMKTGEVSLSFGAYTNERHELPADFDFYENNPNQAPAGIQLSFISEDVHADFARATHAGAIPVVQPNTMPWGQIVSRVRDCNGVLVSIVSPPKF